MSEKRTLIDQLRVAADGTVLVRFQKQKIESGFLTFEYHRTSIPPGADVDKQMWLVNAHLEVMGCARVGDYGALKDRCAQAHTPEVVAAFKALQEQLKVL
jgi:hypothetical protein